MHPVAERGQPLPRDAQCGGVAVEADQPQTGQIGEEAFGVPARTERGVDQHRTRTRRVASGQRGRQQLDAAVEQDRNVSVILAFEIRGHRSTFDCVDPRLVGSRPAGGPCNEVPVRGRGPGVGEVRQGRFGQRPRCTGHVRLVGRVK